MSKRLEIYKRLVEKDQIYNIDLTVYFRLMNLLFSRFFFQFLPSLLSLLEIEFYFFYLLSTRITWFHNPDGVFDMLTPISLGPLHHFISFYFYVICGHHSSN
jgi:hypothetical protein